MRFMEKLERMMMAVTFAEAGEHDTARETLQRQRRRKTKRVTQRRRMQLRAPSGRR